MNPANAFVAIAAAIGTSSGWPTLRSQGRHRASPGLSPAPEGPSLLLPCGHFA
jgi:hypothetical protein